MDTLSVRYTCVLCGLEDMQCSIPARAAGTDIVTWMKNQVITAVQEDHKRRSPWCPAREITTLKIPYSGSGPIGEVIKQ